MGVQTQINRIKNEVDDQTNLISQIKTALADKTSLVKHASTHATGGSDPVTPARIGAKAAGESDVFIETYGTTTHAEMAEALNAGKAVFLYVTENRPRLPLFTGQSYNHTFYYIQGPQKFTKYNCWEDEWTTEVYTITPASIGAAPISTTTEVTLAAASWSGDSAPYTYTLTVNGVTDTSTQEIVFATSINLEQLTAGQNANIQDGGQSANTIVLKAWGEKPTVDLPIRVIMRG